MHSDLQEKGVENCLQTVTKDGFKLEKGTMAGFRPNSKIIGNFRKIENFYGHFIKRQK